MADARKIRDTGSGKPPDAGTRGAVLAEGDRFEVVELDGGRVQVTIDLGHSFVQHSGPPGLLRARIVRDADERDRSAIDGVLRGRP
jgi:hypothetical protein